VRVYDRIRRVMGEGEALCCSHIHSTAAHKHMPLRCTAHVHCNGWGTYLVRRQDPHSPDSSGTSQAHTHHVRCSGSGTHLRSTLLRPSLCRMHICPESHHTDHGHCNHSHTQNPSSQLRRSRHGTCTHPRPGHTTPVQNSCVGTFLWSNRRPSSQGGSGTCDHACTRRGHCTG